jgi:hypothetical protein
MRYIIFLGLILAVATTSPAAEKKTTPSADQGKPVGTAHLVEASVVYPTNAGAGIRAERQPGEFTIPKESSGTKLEYSFHDPKSNSTSTKLRGSNIFSVTKHRYMTELDENPQFELPPGDYKFVVGGEPGAAGTLRYTTVPAIETKPEPPKDPGKTQAWNIPRNGSLTLIVWVSDRPEWKLRWDFKINNGVVTGRGQPLNPVTDDRLQDIRSEHSFQGNSNGNRITGTASQTETWGVKGADIKHRYEGKGKMELQLHADHTVDGSGVQSGTTNGQPSIQNQKTTWTGTWQLGQKPDTKQ